MKRSITLAICLGLAISGTPSSQAAAKVFKNCTELNKVYPGGVALPTLEEMTLVGLDTK
jgi:hypothetical protein